MARWLLATMPMVLLTACATPSDVKLAVKAQSDTYARLDQSLQQFSGTFSNLTTAYLQADEDNRMKLCALVLLEPESGPGLDCGQVTPPNHPSGSEYSQFALSVDQAISPPKQGVADQKLVSSEAENVLAAIDNLRGQTKALAVINSAIADYYGIDLTPGPEATKAAIESIKPLVQ